MVLFWGKNGSQPDPKNVTGSSQNQNQQTEKNYSNS